jgi:hypothetical protein
MGKDEIKQTKAKEEVHLERMEAFLGFRPWGEVTEASPKNSRAGPEEMEAAVVTFGVVATNLEATPRPTEAVVAREELRKKELKVDNIGY